MLPSSVHQISTLCFIHPSVGFWFFLRKPHHTKQTRKALWVSKTTLLSLSLSYTVYSVISSTHSLDIQTRSRCHLLSAVSRTNHKLSRNMISFLPCHPEHLLSYYSCILFAFFFLASALSYSPWLSNSQPNLPLSNDNPMMTIHR